MARTHVPRVECLEARVVPATPWDAPPLGAPPPPGKDVFWVDSEPALQAAARDLQSGQTIVIRPGVYYLSNIVFLGRVRPLTDVTIRGETEDFNDVVLMGPGMDNSQYGFVQHGISVYDAQRVLIANLSVGEVYFFPIEMKGEAGASHVHVYHTRLFNAGMQFIRGGSILQGADNGIVEYTVMEYTDGPPRTNHGSGVGFTQGVDTHLSRDWIVRHNLFYNFHTPDSADHHWNPAILISWYSQNTLVEGNTIIDCDRAIAFGIEERPLDHYGGIIRNNFIYQTPGLFSPWRHDNSDTQIAIFGSPDTKVYHNTVLTNGNSRFSIEARWNTQGVEFRNNLTDAPFRTRDGGTYEASGNYLYATSDMFVDVANWDFHLVSNKATWAVVIDQVTPLADVYDDWDGHWRPAGDYADIGADEWYGQGAPTKTAAVFVPDLALLTELDALERRVKGRIPH